MSTYCEGDKVYLRQVQLSDAPLLVKWKKDPYIQKVTLYPGAEVSVESQKEDIKRAVKADDELYLIVVVKETDNPIGYVRVNFWEEERGKGYGKDALKCFIRHLFNEGVHRFDTEVYEFNIVTLAFLERLGFVREGVKRKAFFDGEKYVDIVVFGLLKEDFNL